MKLPSLFPVVFFPVGILLSSKLHPAALTPRICIVAIALSLIAGCVVLYRRLIVTAAIFGVAAWLLLGFAAANLERASVPPNLASTLIETGKLDTSVALRWRGRLRSDPLQLPWGTRYEIALERGRVLHGNYARHRRAASDLV